MIVRGESTIIDYHAPFDQGFSYTIYNVVNLVLFMITENSCISEIE